MHEEESCTAEKKMLLQAARDVLCNEDLLKLLFEKLGREGLCSAGATCRQWRQIAESDEFWKSLDFSGLSISPWQVFLTQHIRPKPWWHVRNDAESLKYWQQAVCFQIACSDALSMSADDAPVASPSKCAHIES